ncbi:hypothetical protein Peur_017136 [Populus x canadensis]
MRSPLIKPFTSINSPAFVPIERALLADHLATDREAETFKIVLVIMKIALINVLVGGSVPSHPMFEAAGFHAEHLLVRECYRGKGFGGYCCYQQWQNRRLKWGLRN